MAVQLGGQLDPAHQLQTGVVRQRDGLVIPREGVVIGDPQDFYSRADRLLDQLCRRTGAVRFVGVRVQIDQIETRPKCSSVAQIRALPG